MKNEPTITPKNNCFGSGPVKKNDQWAFDTHKKKLQGRSHRSKEGLQHIQDLIISIKTALDIPKIYKVALLVGSATAATEAGIWNLIGAQNLRVYNFDIFSNRWFLDIHEELKPSINIEIENTPFRKIPNLEDNNPDEDLLLCWNGSTSGIMPNSAEWIKEKREGLVFCDATSAAYCIPLPFEKLDVTSFSFQKGLGAEAGIGCLVLSPKAQTRLKSYTPAWGIPRLFRLKDGDFSIFDGKLLNTPSMYALEEISYCHTLYNKEEAYLTVINNKNAFDDEIKKSNLFDHAVTDVCFQSLCTGIFVISCALFRELPQEEQYQILYNMAEILGKKNIAFDFVNHTQQPPSLRLWLGPTMSHQDIRAVFPWLEWSYHVVYKNTQ